MSEAIVKVNVNLKIIPFGSASIEWRTEEREREKIEKKSPVYSQPWTTIPEVIETAFNGDDYIVPKTTDGSF